jgi:serine/threonine-protein phosphatase 6 regulatory subunit 3
MSLWRNFAFQSSPIDNILERVNFSLEELLDEDDILQEIKAQNRKLIDYITRIETLKALIGYISLPPRDISDKRYRDKYPSVACEILCSEVWLVCETIYENEELLQQLYSYLDLPYYIPLVFAYSSRVASVLLQKKPTETFDFYKRKNLLEKLLLHLRNPQVLDLVMKIISCEDTIEKRVNGILEQLAEKELMTKLLKLFLETEEEDLQETLSQAFSEILSSSSDSPLIQQLDSHPLLPTFFESLLAPQVSSSFYECGLRILSALLGRNFCEKENFQNASASADSPSHSLQLSLQYLPKFAQILSGETLNLEGFCATTGPLSPPLGSRRVTTIHFIVLLLKANSPLLQQAFIQNNILSSVFNLFFQYPWNNFLHAAIENLIETILQCDNQELKLQLFTKYRLTDRLIEATELNEQESTKKTGRLGYMGHITNICLLIDKFAEVNPNLNEYLSGTPSFFLLV